MSTLLFHWPAPMLFAIQVRVHLEMYATCWFDNLMNIKPNCHCWAQSPGPSIFCQWTSLSSTVSWRPWDGSSPSPSATLLLHFCPHTCVNSRRSSPAPLNFSPPPSSPESLERLLHQYGSHYPYVAIYMSIWIKFKIHFLGCIWQILSAQQHGAGGYHTG